MQPDAPTGDFMVDALEDNFNLFCISKKLNSFYGYAGYTEELIKKAWEVCKAFPDFSITLPSAGNIIILSSPEIDLELFQIEITLDPGYLVLVGKTPYQVLTITEIDNLLTSTPKHNFH